MMAIISTGELMVCGLLVGVFALAAPVPQKHELKLVYIFEGKKPEHVFVIGDSGFKSVESLKKHLAKMPAGTEIVWNPGCERIGQEPLLSSERQMKAFREFLESKGIKFTLVPAG